MAEGDSKDWSFTSHVGEDLRGADLSGANLRRAILDRADLEGADLSGADLRNASLKGANTFLYPVDAATSKTLSIDDIAAATMATNKKFCVYLRHSIKS